MYRAHQLTSTDSAYASGSTQDGKIVAEQRADRAISESGDSLLVALAFARLDQNTANEAHIIVGASQKKGYVWASASARGRDLHA